MIHSGSFKKGHKVLEEWKESNPNYMKEWWINHQGYLMEWSRENDFKGRYKQIIAAGNLAKKLIQIPKDYKCEVCNINLAVQRHHEDYSKPLEVILCCKKCHGLLDERRHIKEEKLQRGNSRKLLVTTLLTLLIVCIQLVFVSSTTILGDGLINNTEISSTGLNLTINFTSPLYAGVIINSDSIYFENLRSGLNSLERISFNMTEANKNYTNSNLPYFNLSSELSKIITSNISSVNSSTRFSAECDTIGRITYLSAGGVSTSYVNGFFIKQYTCPNDLITLTLQLDQGDNVITLAHDGGQMTACSQSVSAFATYVGLIGLLGAVIFLGLIMSYLTGIVDKNAFKNYSIISVIVTLIMVAVLVIVAIFILSTLCTAL